MHYQFGSLRHFKHICQFSVVLFFGLFFGLPICRANATADSRKVSYLIEPVSDENGIRFRIELEFTGHEAGRTELVLPFRIAGQTGLHETIQKLEVLTPQIKLIASSEPWVKVINHEPEQVIRLRYEMVQDRSDALQAQRGAGFRPIIQPTYFHWLGNAWVHPAFDEAEALSFSMEWKSLPQEWTVSNTFGMNQRQQKFTTTLRDFSSSVFVGGDFRLRSVIVNEHPVQIALRGDWPFSDEELATLVGKIFTIERGFWNDFSYPNYLMTLLPLEPLPNSFSSAGVGLSNSFAMFATPNCTLRDLQYVLAHELFHNWNPDHLGHISYPGESLYWFSEGVTDYYAHRLLWRGGLITFDEYLAKYNEALRNYYTSPLRNESNERLTREFFSDANLSRLAYWRGKLLAGNWDALIRASSNGKHSLDDVMHDLARAGSKSKLSIETINAAIRRYANEDVLSEVKRVIDQGELVMPRHNLFGDCAERVMIEVGEYELGFDLEALQKSMKIQRVSLNSAAYRAGLRDGQMVIRRPAFQTGDASKEIELTVREGATQKTIRFFPSSNNKTLVPQFKLAGGRNAAQKANCEQAF